MVCIGPTPTVDLYLSIPVPLDACSWEWGEHPRWPGVIASEYVYTEREALAIVRTYARSVARQIRPGDADRFTVLARGRVTGLPVARDQWIWNTYAHAYVPHGEPWNAWRTAARRYYELTGILPGRLSFQACHAAYPSCSCTSQVLGKQDMQRAA